jgi:hypothetical protein
MYKIVLAAIATLLLLVVLPGCGSSEPTPTITGPAGADKIAEKLILAYDANDYVSYLDTFDAAATGSVGQDWFQETSKIIIQKVGHYIPKSIVLQEVTPNGKNTDLTYKAKYSDDPDGVTVIVSLSITDKGTFAAGIWFNSPKLFAQ